MKQYRSRFPEAEFTDAEFLDALCESVNRHSNRQAQRKAQQLCRQVQRALNLAFTDIDAVDGLSGLFVDEVSPAPDCGHLLVHVVVPSEQALDEALNALRHELPRLRAEVAKTITRRRAPELTFAPVCWEGGADE